MQLGLKKILLPMRIHWQEDATERITGGQFISLAAAAPSPPRMAEATAMTIFKIVCHTFSFILLIVLLFFEMGTVCAHPWFYIVFLRLRHLPPCFP